VVTPGPTAPASNPPAGLPGLERSWSRLVTTTDADGLDRTWHVLDSCGDDPAAATDAAGTLLCVHGNPTWSYLWRDLLATRPGGWRVMAVDQLEMGFSERTGTHRDLARRIDDLGRLTAELQLTGPVVTVAHDWGGPVSLGWAAAHREQLAGVVLANTAVHQPTDAPAPSLIRAALTPGVLEQVTVRSATFVRGALALARPRLDPAVELAYHAPYRTAARRRGIGGFVRDIPLDPDHPSAATLAGVAADLATFEDVPALLFWGPEDPIFSDRYLHDLEARLPGAQVQRTPGAGHLVVEDTDVADTLARWLPTVPVAAISRSASDDVVDASGAAVPGPSASPASAPRASASRASGSSTSGSSTSRSLTSGSWASGSAASGSRAPLWSTLEEPALSDRLALLEVPHGRGEAAPASRTFGELGAEVRASAAGLAAHGVAAGDRVALLITPGVELAVALYACWRVGAVPVLADAGLGARGLTRALRSAAPDHLIGIERALVAARALGWPGRRIAASSVPAGVRRMTGTRIGLDDLLATGAGRDLPPPPGDDADAAIAFTSGATGAPKGVVYRHRQLQAQRDALATTYSISRDDRLVAAFAPFALYGPALGIPSVVPDMDVTAPSTLTAAALADAVAAIEATMVFASPAALVNVRATADDVDPEVREALSGVRLLLSAGAPVPAELLRSLTPLLPAAQAHTPYGMTEALPVADISLAGIEAAGAGNGVCVGEPVTGVEVTVSPVDALGHADGPVTTEPHVTGELLIRADHVKDRYDRLVATELRSSREPGWHRSGDVGHLDERGRVWVEGRLVHTIATAEGLVTPVGLERRVEGIEHVALAAAVGVGPPGTQQVVIVVQTDPAAGRPQLAPATLTRRVRAAVEVPVAAVLAVPRLPVDIRHNSKIDRGRLASWASGVLAGERMRRP
jgi:olefin beta-lactone synthetase